MDYLTYIANFKASAHWETMSKTIEDSPYHREENVAVHTQMCMDHYMTHFAPLRSDRQNRIAMLQLLAHDFGKPSAEEVLEKKDGSGEVYRRYAGHEQDSATIFTEYWLTDPALRELLTVDEARQVRWMIENHLPYGLKDKAKRSALRTALARVMEDIQETFYDCLRSDAAGRISDNHEQKLQAVEDWIAEFDKVELTPLPKLDPYGGTTWILIGPSGSGKSTWYEKMKRGHWRRLSRDVEYGKFYDKCGMPIIEDPKAAYEAQFRYACLDNEKEFEKFLSERIATTYLDAKIGKMDVVIDNTNGSKKARARYVQAARNIGQRVVAVEFWNTFETLMARQSSRPEKFVPRSSLMQQYYAQTCASLGSEVDDVIVVVGE